MVRAWRGFVLPSIKGRQAFKVGLDCLISHWRVKMEVLGHGSCKFFLHHGGDDGFYNEPIYIKCQRRCDYLRLRERSQHHDSGFRFGVRFSRTDQLNKFQAIHSGHIDVSDDQIECFGLEQIDRKCRIIYIDDFVYPKSCKIRRDLAREIISLCGLCQKDNNLPHNSGIC